MARASSLMILALAALGCESILGLDEFADAQTSSSSGKGGGATSTSSGGTSTTSASGGAPTGGGGAGPTGGGGSSSTTSSGGGGSAPVAKRAFVTEAETDGALAPMSSMTIAAAHGFCQTAADNAALGGMWRAWISKGGTHAVNEIGEGPWYLVDPGTQGPDLSKPVALTKTDLTSFGPTYAISRNENGVGAGGFEVVWTGTVLSGQASGEDCVDWTSNDLSFNATYGVLSAVGNQWTEAASNASCGSPHHLYCFEL